MATQKPKGKGGRPSEWDKKVKDNLDLVVEQIGKGMPEYKVAELLGISDTTWFKYKNEYPELVGAVKKGEAQKIANVEQALYKGAVGYEYEEVKEIITKDKAGKTAVKREVTKKHYQPNPTLIIFTLLNLMGDKYKDRKDIRLTGQLDTKAMTDDEILKRVKELEAVTGVMEEDE